MFGLFKKKQPDFDPFFLEMMSAAKFRSDMDRVLAVLEIRVDPEIKNRLSYEVARVAMSITVQAIKNVGKDFESLTEAHILASSIVTIVATDRITQLAKMPFEATSLAATLGLWAGQMDPDQFSQFFRDSSEEYDQLVRHHGFNKAIVQIGSSVGAFFSSAQVNDLEPITPILGSLMAAYE